MIHRHHEHPQALRFDEGIERVTIKEINNAGASAVAQSQLVVMLDTIADGHVQFAKFAEDCTGTVVLESAPLPVGGQFPMNAAGIALHVANHIFAPGEEGIDSGFYQSVPWPGSDYP